jgi:cysteinyl-tRNA synthetase
MDLNRYRFYVCGLTVYGPGHVGNFRTMILNDVLRRVLEVAGLNPYYVRNITDVDDKTIVNSIKEGLTLKAFTQKWTAKFHEDCERLNLIVPDVEPKATEHLKEQIDLIETLIAKGNAYVGADGSVYYKVRSFSDYGKLAHFKIDELQTQDTNSAGQQNLSDEYSRESAADFALWKARKPEDGDNFWEGPQDPATGKRLPGRPGWHIECSAMSMRYLGETFDLHGGGEDLCFPHHENEIAQSEAATGKPLANHWMHCVHLLVDGKKMSKSLGNFFTLDDLVAQGHDVMAVRYLLVSAHYRQHLNLTQHGLGASQSALQKLEKQVEVWLKVANMSVETFQNLNPLTEDRFHEASVFRPVLDFLLDDLNTPAALGALFSAMKEISTEPKVLTKELQCFATILYALGIKLFTAVQPEKIEAPDFVREKAQARWEAKQKRDWALSDLLRNEVTAAGWRIHDRKDGFDLEPI